MRQPSLEARRAVAAVDRRFPFQGYFAAAPRGHAEIADVVRCLLPAGSRILDFAAGPLDKTAVLQELGFRCEAIDDLSDPWHLLDDNRGRILDFANNEGIAYHLAGEPLPAGPFDMVMAHDILEHLHDSPRAILVELLERVHDGGYLLVTVPNAANLRKRIALLRGKTNLPLYAHYFWESSWRGHVREYVLDDLRDLAHFLGLEIVELRGTHHLAHRLRQPARAIYRLVASVDGLRDTLLLLARKPDRWQPPLAAPPEIQRAIREGASPYFGLI